MVFHNLVGSLISWECLGFIIYFKLKINLKGIGLTLVEKVKHPNCIKESKEMYVLNILT
jgi:hypothetical protein